MNFKKVVGVDNGADLFTKTLSWNEIQSHIHKLSSQFIQDVEESYPTPHIHEQMTTSYYGYDNIMLEPNAMNNIDTVAHMNVHNTQY